jgi:diguanylate cyclase (GGDEF)-like protein
MVAFLVCIARQSSGGGIQMERKVLVVDDDPTSRLILTRVLESNGYQVLVAEDGQQGLSLAKKHTPHYVVADWMMPEMDGLELCRQVKSAPELQPNYFIMVTIRGETPDRIEGLETGADDYLSKPVDEKELLARLKAGERVIRQQESYQSLASTDPLTGLKNRRAFEEDLARELARSRRYGHSFSLLLLDIDRFKQINDTWGHGKGDDVLRLVGRHLVETLRSSDCTYRLGGDEFAVILPETPQTGAEYAAFRLKDTFPGRIGAEEDQFACSVDFSIGCATAQPEIDSAAEELLRAADENMYAAKNAARDSNRERPGACESSEQHGSILVVEDEPVTRKILEKRLKAEGYRPLVAADGGAGLHYLRTEKPEVIILDWMLPDVDGIEICRTVRENEQLEHTYIIMVTAIHGTKSQVHALDTGADDYLSKPINIDELLARVRVGLRIRRLQEQISQMKKLEGVIQMARAAAHELNQPLTAILGLADLLRTITEPSETHHPNLEQIAAQAKRLGEIANKIGRITRCEIKEYAEGIQIVDIDKASESRRERLSQSHRASEPQLKDRTTADRAQGTEHGAS